MPHLQAGLVDMPARGVEHGLAHQPVRPRIARDDARLRYFRSQLHEL